MDNKQRALRIEKLAVAARLHDIAIQMTEGEASRLMKIYAVLERLDPGVYLIGAGPHTQGVFSLMCEKIVIGRLATPLEELLHEPVDVHVNDGATLTPREVSRVHCMICRGKGMTRQDYWLIDRGSTCGTYLNGEKLDPPTTPSPEDVALARRTLSDGDVISLGPSGVNNFLFVDLRKRK
jgi:pSer/pThr/pTyr-binding forkhead associated (FHA) protein